MTTLEHRIVVIWRREATRIHYEWLNETWPTCAKCHPDELEEGGARGEEAIRYHERLNETKRALEQLVKRLLRPTEVVAYETRVQVMCILIKFCTKIAYTLIVGIVWL